MEPIRVAEIVGYMGYGGVEAMLMNYYRHIDKTKIQFDFFVDADSPCPFKDEIESLGGKIYYIPPYTKLHSYNKTLKKLLKENNYKIIHSHINTLSIFPLRIAKKVGIPVRIAHSHSTANKKEILRSLVKYLLRPFSKIYPNYYFACSNYAGKWLFGNKAYKKGKITVINNAIEMDKFRFNLDKRNELRDKFKISDSDILLGNVGRFVDQKNQIFLIHLLNLLVKANNNYKLILVGDGPNKEKIINEINKYDLASKVILTGNVLEPYNYYNAMDIFVSPSLYEGFSIVSLEAELNGVACILSSNITREIKILDSLCFLPLNIDDWYNQIINLKLDNNREVNINDFIKYDINKQAKRLENIYLDCVGGVK